MTLVAAPSLAAAHGHDRAGLRGGIEGAHHGRFFGRSYLGPSYFDGAYFGIGSGLILPAAAPAPEVVPLPRRCAPPPLVIKVGRGIARPATTRILYGLPGCAD